MFKFYLKDIRSIWLFIADLIVLSGVIYYGWNPDRMMLYFGFNVGMCILSFVIYNILITGLSILSSALLVSIIIVVPLYYITNALLIPPYFDFGMILTFSIIAQFQDVRKYLGYAAFVAKPGFALYVGILFLMLPFLYILPKGFMLLSLPKNISVVIAFILIRQYAEYKRYKKFEEIEKEMEAYKNKIAS